MSSKSHQIISIDVDTEQNLPTSKSLPDDFNDISEQTSINEGKKTLTIIKSAQGSSKNLS